MSVYRRNNDSRRFGSSSGAVVALPLVLFAVGISAQIAPTINGEAVSRPGHVPVTAASPMTTLGVLGMYITAILMIMAPIGQAGGSHNNDILSIW